MLPSLCLMRLFVFPESLLGSSYSLNMKLCIISQFSVFFFVMDKRCSEHAMPSLFIEISNENPNTTYRRLGWQWMVDWLQRYYNYIFLSSDHFVGGFFWYFSLVHASVLCFKLWNIISFIPLLLKFNSFIASKLHSLTHKHRKCIGIRFIQKRK